jgi:hypothetical protein
VPLPKLPGAFRIANFDGCQLLEKQRQVADTELLV